MPRAVRSSAVALAVVLAASGCFGGGGASSGTSGSTRAQFIARAVAVCNRYQHQIGVLPQVTDLPGLAVAAGRAVALQRRELHDLRALTPPRADRAAVGRLLGSLQLSIGAGSRLSAAAASGDRTAVLAATQVLTARLLETNRLAQPFGLGSCAR
jgi:hypothetical protein